MKTHHQLPTEFDNAIPRVGLSGVSALEAEMRDRLAERDRQISLLAARAQAAEATIARCEQLAALWQRPVFGAASKRFAKDLRKALQPPAPVWPKLGEPE